MEMICGGQRVMLRIHTLTVKDYFSRVMLVLPVLLGQEGSQEML